MRQHAEKEILVPTLLCDDKGNLNPKAIGFARRPIIESNLKGHYMRKKKWNYWCIFGDEVLFSVTISHLDYAAVCFVYFLNYETQRFVERTVTIPLGTKVFVEGYGYAVAADTGGAIKGNKIDVFIANKSQAYKWGRKKVKIRILD